MSKENSPTFALEARIAALEARVVQLETMAHSSVDPAPMIRAIMAADTVLIAGRRRETKSR
jgi:hypothetical protein